MKITYLHQYFVPPSAVGGTRSYEFARRLQSNGHDVHFITSSAFLPDDQAQKYTKITHTEIADIPMTVIPVQYSNKLSFNARIRAFLKFAIISSYYAAKQQSDVIFATSTPLTIAIPGMIGHYIRRVPMVLEVRDLWPELPIAMGALNNPFLRQAALALEYRAYHSSEHVVALSPGMAEGVIKRGKSPEDVTIIPNSCDISLFDIPTENGDYIRDKLNLQPNQPLVVYTGTFGLINGVDYLVKVAQEALKLDYDLHFLLVGDGSERSKVEQLAQETGVIGKNLSIWNSLPKNEIPNVLAAATIATSLFIPLEPMWNNSANKFFDALASATPIAINYKGWQAEVLTSSQAGFVLPHDNPNEAAQLLHQFAHNEEQKQQAIEAARHLAKTQFNRDLMAQKLEAVLKKVVEKAKNKN